jgi:hypothetical protein
MPVLFTSIISCTFMLCSSLCMVLTRSLGLEKEHEPQVSENAETQNK